MSTPTIRVAERRAAIDPMGHMSPRWGLGELLMFYKHAAPLGLWVGQDARPTWVIVGFHSIYL